MEPTSIGSSDEAAAPVAAESRDEFWNRQIKTPDEPIPHAIDKSMGTTKDRIYSHIWRRFLPAIFLYPLWIYVMVKHSASGALDPWASSFGTYYPLSIAMIFGSMIAGSTPLGGGVVAFPVTVLLIKFKPEQGRDFSLIIQSIGMTAASFLIIYAKRQLCHVWLILWSLLFGMLGMIVGFEITVSGFVVNVTFTTAIVCFALAFGYRNTFAAAKSAKKDAAYSTVPNEAWALMESSSGFDLESNPVSAYFGKYFPLALTACVCVFGFVGGFLTAKLGSGADMLAYIFGVFVWNTTVPKGAELPDNMLTASSVVIMAGCSIMGTLMRLLTGGMSSEVLYCWAACVPIVVLGAPVGSLLLTPKMTDNLRRCFYLLALVQLVSFGVLKIKDNVLAWVGIFGVLLLESLCLGLHYMFVVKGKKQASASCEEQQSEACRA